MTVPMFLWSSFVLVSLCHLVVKISAREEDWKVKLPMNKTTKLFHAHALARRDQTFVYAVCDDALFPTVVRCDVILKTWSAGNRDRTKVCPITINPGENKMFFRSSFDMKLESLGDPEYTIITYSEVSQHLEPEINIHDQVITLKMSTCAKKHLSFVVSEPYSSEISPRNRLIPYKDSFDLITTDGIKCKNYKKCKISIDKRGNQIGSTISLPIDSLIVRTKSILPTSPSNGLLILEYMKSDPFAPTGLITAEYANGAGHVKKLQLSFKNDFKGSLTDLDTMYNKFTICSMGPVVLIKSGVQERSLVCNQFEPNRLEPRIDKTMKYNSNVTALAVHNLPKGGFLVLVLECSGRLTDSPCVLRAYKVDFKGKQYTKFSAPSNCSKKTTIFTVDIGEEGNDFCFYNFCILEEDVDSKQRGGVKQLEKTINLQKYCVPAKQVTDNE